MDESAEILGRKFRSSLHQVEKRAKEATIESNA